MTACRITFEGELTLTTNSQIILPDDGQRIFLFIYVIGAGRVAAKFKDDFANGETGMELTEGQAYCPSAAPINKIYMRAVSGTVKIYVKSGVRT